MLYASLMAPFRRGTTWVSLNVLVAVAVAVALQSPAWPQGVSGRAMAPAASENIETAPALNADETATLIRALDASESQGFGPDAFHVREIKERLASSDPAQQKQGMADLEDAAIAYAGAQHGERVPASRFRRDWAIRPAPYDAWSDFAAAVTEHRLSAWVAGLPPPNQRYARLIAAYGRYREIAAHGGWPVLAMKSPLKPGASGEAVEALRQRLAVEDPATPGAPSPGPAFYDVPLTAAVSRAQARFGLTADGVAGIATLAALNVPVEHRLAQIRANLERWRWAPRTLPEFRVALNIADATLALYDDGATVLTMRTIVGRAARPTPMFEDRITAIVLNPPWNVPADIAAAEIWPKIRRDPGYMARERFVTRPGGGLQQLPGPKCALGTIKFDLSNPFGVYLHDTPVHSLFARDDRALSHGCMRLENPNLLARRLLAGDPGWPASRIDDTLLGGKTTRAPLPRPVPLYVFYQTAFVDDQGQLHFRPDVYGWDKVLLGLI